MRKVLSGIFLLTAIGIGLGAFGHGSQWPRHVLPTVQGLDPHTVKLLEFVWYWVSGAMLTLGVLLVWTWWRMGRGERNLAFLPWIVGVFYFMEGVYGAIYLGRFFLVFIVLAVLLSGTTLALTRMRRA